VFELTDVPVALVRGLVRDALHARDQLGRVMGIE
jgi:hypothetical protein